MQNGIVLLIAAMSLTPGIDALAKHMSSLHSPFQVSFFRYLAAGVVALSVARMTGKPIEIPRKGRIGHFYRTAILVAAMTLLITALSMVSLANAVGGFLVAPIVSTVLCVVFLGESLTVARTFGVIASVIGAIVIARPEAGLETGTLLALGGGVLLGTYLAATRAAKDTGGTLSTLVIQCFLAAALLSPLAFMDGIPRVEPILLVYIAGLGVLSAMAHFLTVAAFERADASVLSPFMYFNLVAAIAVGYLFFGEVPSGVEFAGLAFIALGGLAAALPWSRLQTYFLLASPRTA